MQRDEYEKEIFLEKLLNYTNIENKVYNKALKITEKIGKINVRLKDVFNNYRIISRIFAFVESKYSFQIEGIYTTLFDVVNTNDDTKSDKVLSPIIEELLNGNKKNKISYEKVKKIMLRINFQKDEKKRWTENFGIYKKKTKIYDPPKNKEFVDNFLRKMIKKINNDTNIVDIFITHILFEKLHPFVDGNGRIGRLILQKSLTKLMNFTNVLPISWAFYQNMHYYYKAFDFDNIDTKIINASLLDLLDIFNKMYDTIKKFTKKIFEFKEKWISFILKSSSKMNHEIAYDILLTLQTSRIYIEKKYKLNVRTIETIFEKLNKKLPFNRKKKRGKVLYWNIELEEIIDEFFNMNK